MGSAAEKIEVHTIALTDFRLAGFLVARHIPMIYVTVNDRNEVVFVFQDDDGKATQCITAFPGSPEQVYDVACKTMYDLVKARLRQGKLTPRQ